MALTRITTGSISANTITSEKVQNASIQARHFQVGTITNNLLEANANVAAAETRVNANLDIVQDNVVIVNNSVNTVQDNVVAAEANVVLNTSNIDSFASFANTNLDTKANVSSTFIQLDANIDLTNDNATAVLSNLDAFASFANTNLDTKANVSATLFTARANDFATFTLLNANVNDVQDNVTSIHSGSQEFTTSKIFQQNVTIQGNLIVVGSQVDLGVGTATIDDNFIVVSANLTGTPATDSGIIVNRGAKGNVFIGDHIVEDGIVFALSQSPHDNATIAIQEYLDVHANAFHAESGMNFSRVHFGHVNDETTGIIVDTTNTHIKFIVGGAEKANLTSGGNLFLGTGIIHGPSAENTLDLDDDELGDRQNSITLRSLQSVGVFLDSNDSETGNFFNIYDAEDNPNAVGRDDGIFSVRDTGEVFITDDISVKGNANVTLDAVVSNAVIGTRVFEGTVGLQANDSATYFAAFANDFVTYTRLNANLDVITDNLVSAQTVSHANDFITYTRLNANVNTVQSNLSTAHTSLSSNINTVQNNVDAITGGSTLLTPFTNVNSALGTSNVFFVGRDIGAEANVVLVMLDGVSQPNTEYEVNASNNTVQFTDATIPSGTTVQIFSLS